MHEAFFILWLKRFKYIINNASKWQDLIYIQQWMLYNTIYQNKGPHLNIVEWFYIHKEASCNNQLSDKKSIFPNTIFCTILKMGTQLTYPHSLLTTPTLPFNHLPYLFPFNSLCHSRYTKQLRTVVSVWLSAVLKLYLSYTIQFMYSHSLHKQHYLYKKLNIYNCIPNTQKHVIHLCTTPHTKSTPCTPY